MSKIVTANLLATGTVVFLGPDDTWVANVADAVRYPDDAAAGTGLAVGERDAKRAIIVDPFVTDATGEPDGKPAMTLRDTIRAFGPTIDFLPAGAKTA